jgi:hypothetical protein
MPGMRKDGNQCTEFDRYSDKIYEDFLWRLVGGGNEGEEEGGRRKRERRERRKRRKRRKGRGGRRSPSK